MEINHQWLIDQSVVCTVENAEIRLVSFSVAEILYEEIKQIRMRLNTEKYPESMIQENEDLRRRIRELEQELENRSDYEKQRQVHEEQFDDIKRRLREGRKR